MATVEPCLACLRARDFGQAGCASHVPMAPAIPSGIVAPIADAPRPLEPNLCECGADDWECSATLIACRRCSRTFGRCNGVWVFDHAGYIAHLEAAIRKHHDQKADDRCIFDDTELYAAAGLPPADHRVGDKDAMLANCRRFIERRCEAGGWPTYAALQEALRESLALVTADEVPGLHRDHGAGDGTNGVWCGRCQTRARLAALAQPAATGGEVKPVSPERFDEAGDQRCARCGGPHAYDTSLPHETWNTLMRPDGVERRDEMLCGGCVLAIAARAGVGFTAKLWGNGLYGIPVDVRVQPSAEPPAAAADRQPEPPPQNINVFLLLALAEQNGTDSRVVDGIRKLGEAFDVADAELREWRSGGAAECLRQVHVDLASERERRTIAQEALRESVAAADRARADERERIAADLDAWADAWPGATQSIDNIDIKLVGPLVIRRAAERIREESLPAAAPRAQGEPANPDPLRDPHEALRAARRVLAHCRSLFSDIRLRHVTWLQVEQRATNLDEEAHLALVGCVAPPLTDAERADGVELPGPWGVVEYGIRCLPTCRGNCTCGAIRAMTQLRALHAESGADEEDR